MFKLTNSYIEDVERLGFKADKLSTTDKKLIEKFQNAYKELSNSRKDLKTLANNIEKGKHDKVDKNKTDKK
ncbi:hypothetical protein [Enterococcus hailinensis]|uniref:hypothetical protein n=1 Tax=Enterococcus hailinensis TaxID=3238988 RepID=UPI0038B3C46A